MPKNFYNLPPPWNPGLAIPGNVMDEGLERHAYVTRMLSRGTYDSATQGGGYGGYAIPQYVLNEGTGRGTFTTKWLPRGYYGPNLPHYLNRQPVANIVLGDVPQMLPGTTFTGITQTIPTTTPYQPPAPPKRDNRPDRRGGGGIVGQGGGTASGVMTAPPPQESLVGRFLPLALLGGAAFLAYRLLVKKKAEAPTP